MLHTKQFPHLENNGTNSTYVFSYTHSLGITLTRNNNNFYLAAPDNKHVFIVHVPPKTCKLKWFGERCISLELTPMYFKTFLDD